MQAVLVSLEKVIRTVLNVITCSFFMMSFRNRKFSLDSSVCLDGVGVFGHRRGSSGKKSRPSKSLDEARLKIHEFNHTYNSNTTVREQTIAEEKENQHQAQELNSHSFQKHNKSFHKLFQEIPEVENLDHMFTCALQKEVLYHGKLFISENHVCFYSSVLLKDTKVVIPTSSVTEVKKHHSALSMLSIQTNDGDKYSFVSLRNRETCYKLLQSVCSFEQQEETPNSLSSADNDADLDVVSSYSSLEDSIDHSLRRQNSFDLDHFPQISSDNPTKCLSTHQSNTNENDHALSWIWRLTEKVVSVFLLRGIRNVSVVFYIYIMLIVLLMLTSIYIGLKIIALEEQLTSLGALTELSLHHREYQET